MSSVLTQLGQKVKAKLDNKLNTSGGTISGDLTISQVLQLGAYTSTSLPSSGTAGRVAYVSDGDSGNPCLAVDNGTDWLISSLGSAIPQAINITDELGNALLTEAGDIIIADA
jgi:hypothetical protein